MAFHKAQLAMARKRGWVLTPSGALVLEKAEGGRQVVLSVEEFKHAENVGDSATYHIRFLYYERLVWGKELTSMLVNVLTYCESIMDGAMGACLTEIEREKELYQ